MEDGVKDVMSESLEEIIGCWKNIQKRKRLEGRLYNEFV
jgi:hypothetical protein